MIDPERLKHAISNLAANVPADIQEAQEIIRQKDSIVNQAQLESRRIKEKSDQEYQSLIRAAKQEHQERIDETEIVKSAESKSEETHQQALQDAQQIVQEAQRKAYRIIEESETVSSNRREGADQYAREILFDLEERLANKLGEVRRGIDVLGLQVPANGTNSSAGNNSDSTEPAVLSG